MDARPDPEQGGQMTVPGRRALSQGWVRLAAVVAFVVVLWAGGRVIGGDASAVDLTGHWASPLEASGIDIVQSGSRVWGSSHSGLQLEGTISGRRVDFSFWRGRTFERTDPEDRGTGVMLVAKNGQRAAVTWRNDTKAPDEGRFVIVRVGPPDTDVPKAALADGRLDPDPGASLSPEDKADLDELYERLLDSIEQVRLPGLVDPNSTPAPIPRPVRLPAGAAAAEEGIDAALPDPSWAPLWTPPPKTQEEWEVIFQETLDAIEQTLGSIQTQILDALVEASAEQLEDDASP
jgi:hypothetical protein